MQNRNVLGFKGNSVVVESVLRCLGQAFWRIISMDGLEISATALSNTMVCPTCECPKEVLDRTDKLNLTKSTDDVRATCRAADSEP